VTEAGAGDLVDARLSVVRSREDPLCLDHLRFEEALEGWMRRVLFNLQWMTGVMLYVLDTGISVGRLTAERLENHPLKNARKKIARPIASISDQASSRNA
jgi:hypothetical protein